MMALKRVEEPAVSPDGRWVLFAAVDVDLAANTKTPHIWVVPLPGRGKPGASESKAGDRTDAPMAEVGQEREVISDQDADRPRWAPDGKRFAFISTKEAGSQIWIADFDATTGTLTGRRRLTNLATGTDGELWSPDGKNILFVSKVYPECQGTPGDETSCNEQKLKQARDSKVSAQIFSHLLYRHWNGYKESKRSHLFVIPSDACSPTASNQICGAALARDLTPGDHDVPPFQLGGQDMYAFSPDGQEVCYTSNHDEAEATSTNNDLFLITANSTGLPRAAKNITADNQAADEMPLYSPDGHYIAYRAQLRPGDESDRWGLMLYDRETGEKKDLTQGFDQWVTGFAWAPDSKTIYFTSDHLRHSLIYAVATTSTSGHATQPEFRRRTLVGGHNDDLSVTADGTTLVFTRMSTTAPNEIYAAEALGPGCPAKTGNVDRGSENCSLNHDWAVTHVNDHLLSQISMANPDAFWFVGANREKVEGTLVKPPNFDSSQKYPVKFLIHGGPEGSWGDAWSYRWNPQLLAADGYVVVMINFHGSTGYGQRFIDAINGDWGGAPFEDLMKGLDYVEQQYSFVDLERECALGASYGGYMANWILGHTRRFKCIVSAEAAEF